MNITVIGNGAWGSAAAALARRRGHAVLIWGRRPRLRSGGASRREDETTDLAGALRGAEMALFATPSHAMREVCGRAKEHLPRNALLISLVKGIEQDTDLRMSEVIARVTGRERVAVMSGPTFASEVARGAPSALVCAASDERWAKAVQSAFNGEDFRVYTSTDVAGVELGGALKNVMAIAAGACVGMGLGDNALAALITRGLAELTRIGVALGGRAQTFFGLSGVGDLILTCSSSQSRNRRVGEGLGQGRAIGEILASLEGTAEGVRTARSVQQILAERKLTAPILQEVYALLYEGKPAKKAVRTLMTREPKAEFDDPKAGRL
ncbi:MAG: NAD(P)-dependent glycerol-3-phosphate dehydrogenase [Verrucomicrobia bacterium]|nr:NAD(P)-dependent glycerol-3-phosphate dehydrogenase [Verrucomicrobiota bacterium]